MTGDPHDIPALGALSLGPDALDMLAAAHLGLREALSSLDRAVADPPDREAAARAAAALPEALRRHVADEEDILFPLLLRRARAEDGLGPTLERLTAEHVALAAAAAAAVSALTRFAWGAERPRDRAAIEAFKWAKRRHIAFEGAVVLPLARARLTTADRLTLARRIADGHGVCLLPRKPEPSHA
jgi:hemerythrin-like domain-containing protein